MSIQEQVAFDQSGNDADFLKTLFEKADRVLIKKLSKNDRDWAHNSKKHQAGVYIPHKQRDGGFFPLLEVMERSDGESDVIRERFFETIWPQINGNKLSRLVH